MARLLLSLSLCLAATVASVARAHGNDAMSHVFIAEAIPSTDVVMVATTTEGPYYESESDYINSTDMTAAGKAGAAGVTTNRASVLNGIPLTLTLGLYSVAGTTATELVGADVFLWHCDAAGVYSAVSVSEQRAEGTLGQKWLRGVQTTPANGSVSFHTILPGWYTGRTVHYHLRVRLAGSTSWAVTTQFFVSDAAVNSYKNLAPYVSNTGTITTLASDGIYNGISSTVASKLVLNLVGSNTVGYTASMNVGIAMSVSAVTTTTTTSSGVAQPPSTTSAATAGTTASPLAVTAAASSSSAFSALSLPATTAVTAVLLVTIAALW